MADEIYTASQHQPVPTHHDTYESLTKDIRPDSLAGKVAIVTGAGRSIGSKICKALASAGASLACICRTKSELDTIMRDLRLLHGVQAIGICEDGAKESSLGKIIRETVERLGPVDILINNAGIYRLNTLEHEEDFQDWWRVIEVNLRGPLLH